MFTSNRTSDRQNSFEPISPGSKQGKGRLNAGFFLTFLVMFAMWLVFSGRFDAFHLILGVLSSLIVAFLSGDLLFPADLERALPLVWLRSIGYIPWLLFQILKANLQGKSK